MTNTDSYDDGYDRDWVDEFDDHAQRGLWHTLGCWAAAAIVSSAIWYGLIWAAVEGWRYVGVR